MVDLQGSEFLQRFFSSEAVLVALLPFLGALMAFSFEAGYLLHYGVPLALMRIDVVRVAVACILTVPVLFLLLAYTRTLERFILRGGRIGPALVILLGGGVINAAVLSFLEMPGKWLIFLGVASVIFSVALLLPLWRRAKGTSYLSALAEFDGGIRDSVDQREIGLLRLKALGTTALLISMLVACIGTIRAQEKDEYLVLVGQESTALVEVYDDLAVLVSFDPATNIILPEITLMRFNDAPLLLRRARIGELEKDWLSSCKKLIKDARCKAQKTPTGGITQS